MKQLSENFLKVSTKLERLNKDFLIDGVPEEYKDIWKPNDRTELWALERGSAELLRSFVLIKQPKTILELGTSAGYSTIWLASGAEEYGGHVYTIEAEKPKIEMAKKTFAKSGLQNSITQLESVIANVLERWDKEIDFLFLDADKIKYFKYLKKLEPLLSDGAVIVADNAVNLAHSMQDYIQYVSTDNKYISQLVNIEHGLLISNYRKD